MTAIMVDFGVGYALFVLELMLYSAYNEDISIEWIGDNER